MHTLLQTPEDMQWLAEVHTPLAANGYAAAIVYGNEDCPDEIHLFARNHIACEPTILARSETLGKLLLMKEGEQPQPKN